MPAAILTSEQQLPHRSQRSSVPDGLVSKQLVLVLVLPQHSLRRWASKPRASGSALVER